MTQFAKMMVSSIADFFIGAGAVITGAMVQQGDVIMPSTAVLVLAAVTGGVQFGMHLKAWAGQPPAKA